jgi:hypothetical protein
MAGSTELMLEYWNQEKKRGEEEGLQIQTCPHSWLTPGSPFELGLVSGIK